jgi:beta-galactosidase
MFDFQLLTSRLKRILSALIFAISFVVMAADSPRERLSMDFNWRFHLGDAPDAGTNFDYPEVKELAKTRLNEIGLGAKLISDLPDPATSNLGVDVSFAKLDFDDSGWRKLDLPHDWAVELPFNTNADVRHGFKPVGTGFPENSVGWYRREFDLPASDKDRALWIEFDGVYRNSLVWLNGHCLGRNVSGYSSFRYDIGKFANYGGKNVLVVRVDASRFEGWFYEGAGIYRHVWLVKSPQIRIGSLGTQITTSEISKDSAEEVSIRVNVENQSPSNTDVFVRNDIYELMPNGQKGRLALDHFPIQWIEGFAAGQTNISTQKFTIPNPRFWSPEEPNLYVAVTTIERPVCSGCNAVDVLDECETVFGIRTIAFDPNKGFLLNGKSYVIKGTCNHQDHAGVGSAMPDALQYFRVKRLKEMGCNAIRTSHNPPTPELLDACDRLGLLVMDENRRVDETPVALDDLRRLVLRDRNHPSVFIWSLGNEEGQLQATNAPAHEAAIKLITPMQQMVHELDPTRLCTIAMNGGWGEGFTKVIDVQGFNYRTRNIDRFRADFPTKLDIGTETASTRTTRGIYADDKQRGYVAAFGENGVEKAWTWWAYYAAHPFTSGGFVWTGFDYRGEPTPYKWPCISSHFGLMDTCGFPKDLYYYYLAWWTEKPVLHLMPHWNRSGREGQTNLVRCFSNCKTVDLFLNGKSLGKQDMPANEYLDWQVAYAPGVLSAKGYNGSKRVAETKVETTGAPAAVRLQPDHSNIIADARDLSIVDVSIVDAKGRVVPDADNLVQFELKGPGKIIGVGNGDPSSHEADKASERHAFNGYAQVIVQSSLEPGMIQLVANSSKITSATLKLKTEASRSPLAVLP